MKSFLHYAVQDGVVDECLPFFEGDYQERNEVESVRYRSSDLNYCRQVIMGVPTHYQNDGSYLYMLTPAFSPPSADTVHKWLFCDGSVSMVVYAIKLPSITEKELSIHRDRKGLSWKEKPPAGTTYS
ncbi:hypothetical protein LguiB_021028 [Lonicera macranthoides]